MIPLTFFTISSSAFTGFETPGDRMFRTYFERETAGISKQCLANIQTLDDWKKTKEVSGTIVRNAESATSSP